MQQVIEKELKKRESKIYAFFVDLKAFDTVKREKLWKTMVRKEIRIG